MSIPIPPAVDRIGVGSPEGRYAAPVGSRYRDSAATNGAIEWIKASGTGSTGWRVVYGDTGWRDVSADLRLGATGTLQIRRAGMSAYWRMKDYVPGTAHAFYWPPAGLAAPSDPLTYPPQSPDNPSGIYIDNTGRLSRSINAGAIATGQWWEGTYLIPVGEGWPTTLPGIPA